MIDALSHLQEKIVKAADDLADTLAQAAAYAQRNGSDSATKRAKNAAEALLKVQQVLAVVQAPPAPPSDGKAKK